MAARSTQPGTGSGIVAVAFVGIAFVLLLGGALAGVVAFDDEVVVPVAGAEVVAPIAVERIEVGAHDEGAQVARHATVEPGSDVVAPVRVERRLLASREHYTGPLAVTAAEVVVWQGELVNSEPLALDVPVGVREIMFQAPGYRPVVSAWPVPRAKPKDKVASIVLEPAATLSFRVEGLGAEDGKLDVAATALGLRGYLRTNSTDPREGPFVPGVELTCTVSLDVGNRHYRWTRTETALAHDERRELVFDTTTVPLVRHRLVDASPQLRERLEVWRRSPHGNGADSEAIVFDSDGIAHLPSLPGALFRTRGVDLRVDTDVQEVRLFIDGRVVAVGCRDAQGTALRTHLFHDSGHEWTAEHTLHPVARSSTEAKWVGPTRQEAVALDVARLPTDRDVVWLEVDDRNGMPAIELDLGSEFGSPKARSPGAVAIVFDGVVQRLHRPAREGVVVQVPAGRQVSLRWRVGSTDCDWIARDLVLARGERRRLGTQWPAVRTWRGTVAGHTTTPPAERWHQVAWGERNVQRSFGENFDRIGDDGGFTLTLPAASPLPASWRLLCRQAPVEARITAVDTERATFVVAPAGDVDSLQPVVRFAAPWTVFVADVDSHVPTFVARHDAQWPLRFRTGTVQHGFVVRDRTTLAWITLSASDPTVRDLGGRTVPLQASFEQAEKWYCLVGPAGQWDLGGQLERGAVTSIFVPHGTRGIAVWDSDAPGSLPTEHALPADGPFVVR